MKWQHGLASFVVAITLATMPTSTPLAQARQVQQRTLPPPGPGQNLASPEVRQQGEALCPGYQIHVTVRGVAFNCLDADAGTNYVVVVLEGQYPGAGEAVVDLLGNDEQRALSSAYIQDPRRRGASVRIRHREASSASQAVCSLVGVSNTDSCREMIYVTFF